MDGISKTRLYSIFSGMKQRCYNPNAQNYKWYGGRGVTICDEWMGQGGLHRFIEWALNNGYEEHLTIDRIDSQRAYSPDNCRWITQSMNSSKAAQKELINQEGKCMTFEQKIKMALAHADISQAELARRLNTTPSNLNQKIKRNTLTNEDMEAIAAALNILWRAEFICGDGMVI